MTDFLFHIFWPAIFSGFFHFLAFAVACSAVWFGGGWLAIVSLVVALIAIPIGIAVCWYSFGFAFQFDYACENYFIGMPLCRFFWFIILPILIATNLATWTLAHRAYKIASGEAYIWIRKH